MTANEIISLLDSFRYVYDGEPLSEYSEIFSVFPEEIYENGTYLLGAKIMINNTFLMSGIMTIIMD